MPRNQHYVRDNFTVFDGADQPSPGLSKTIEMLARNHAQFLPNLSTTMSQALLTVPMIKSAYTLHCLTSNTHPHAPTAIDSEIWRLVDGSFRNVSQFQDPQEHEHVSAVNSAAMSARNIVKAPEDIVQEKAHLIARISMSGCNAKVFAEEAPEDEVEDFEVYKVETVHFLVC